MGEQLSALKTPHTLDEVWEALAKAAPDWTVREREYAAALVWVETARGKSVIRDNVGNLMAAGFVNGREVFSWKNNYWRPSWFADESSQLHAKMLKGEAPSAFRAYSDFTAGMSSFVALLNRDRYAPLKVAANSDDPLAYALALSSSGYSRDYNKAHAPTFRSIVAEIRAAFPTEAIGVVPSPTISPSKAPALALALGVAALGVGVVLYASRKK